MSSPSAHTDTEREHQDLPQNPDIEDTESEPMEDESDDESDDTPPVSLQSVNSPEPLLPCHHIPRSPGGTPRRGPYRFAGGPSITIGPRKTIRQPLPAGRLAPRDPDASVGSSIPMPLPQADPYLTVQLALVSDQVRELQRQVTVMRDREAVRVEEARVMRRQISRLQEAEELYGDAIDYHREENATIREFMEDLEDRVRALTQRVITLEQRPFRADGSSGRAGASTSARACAHQSHSSPY